MASCFEAITMVVFDTATLTGTFEPLNPTGFSDDIKIFKIFNGSTVGVTISYNGVTPNDFYPATSTLIVDLQTNHEDTSNTGSGTLGGRKGQIVWGMGTAGTGNIYIIGYR
jgi:hypothetical protein